MARPSIEPITDSTLPEFAAFLHEHMTIPRSAEEWMVGLSANWLANRPNFGFVLREDGRIVGGIGAIYAERIIRGRKENFCNITSWCVLDTHRKYSMQLAMAVIAQPGFHFTDFSPTKVVGASLQFLKFKPIDERVTVFLNVPALRFSGRTITDSTRIEQVLKDTDLSVWHDHKEFPWLKHVLVGKPGRWCHIIYKRELFKQLPSAKVIYLSDPEVLERHFHRFAWHLLTKGILTTHVESRWLTRLPLFARIRRGFTPKQFLSTTLEAPDIDYLCSETVALDL